MSCQSGRHPPCRRPQSNAHPPPSRCHPTHPIRRLTSFLHSPGAAVLACCLPRWLGTCCVCFLRVVRYCCMAAHDAKFSHCAVGMCCLAAQMRRGSQPDPRGHSARPAAVLCLYEPPWTAALSHRRYLPSQREEGHRLCLLVRHSTPRIHHTHLSPVGSKQTSHRYQDAFTKQQS